MSFECDLTTYPGHTFTPQDFSIMIERMSPMPTGVLSGCSVTAASGYNNRVNVSRGWASVRGRLVKVPEGTLDLTLPTTSGLKQYFVGLTVDLDNGEYPARCTYWTYAPGYGSVNFNENDSGVGYCLFARINITSSGIQAVVPYSYTHVGSEIDTVIPGGTGAGKWNWVDNNAWICEITVQGVDYGTHQEVIPHATINPQQFEALQEAQIIACGQATQMLRFRAFGTVPTVDIPITIILRGKM